MIFNENGIIINESFKNKVFDKISYYDNNEYQKEVLKQFEQLFQYLHDNKMLTSDGEEIYSERLYSDVSLHSGLLTKEGIKYVQKYGRNTFKYINNIDPSVLSDFEKKFKCKIPKDLKETLLNFNGAHSSLKTIDIPNTRGGQVFGSLLSYNDNDLNNVYTFLDPVSDNNFIDKNGKLIAIPFGISPGGDVFCIQNNKVMYWEHETNEFIFVSKSFSNFLHMLY